ncbi:MAG TPA: DUF3299 domain-containing protein [Phycisphaerae bacterium]|nr:DUF3299 domain-containing protein [Phycisphaerae bacterium]
MKKLIGLLALMLVAGMLTGYVLFGKPSLDKQAQSAMDAKDYPKAFALYKEYAQSPALRTNVSEHDRVVRILAELQKKDPSLGVKPAPAVAAAKDAPASAAASQGDLASQALSYALNNNGDPPMSPETRIPHTKPKYGEVLTMSIKELGNFDFDPVFDTDIPADVKLMEGAHVKLSGYMVPLTQAVKVDKFALVPSLSGCCFGAPPGVQHVITCTTPNNKAMDYVLDELEIEGVVHVRVQREDNYTNSIFEMDVTSARIKE